MKKNIFTLLGIITPVIITPITVVSCIKVPGSQKKLTTTQIQTIENGFKFEITEAGKKLTNEKLFELINNTYKKYETDPRTFANNLKTDKELSKYINLDFVNINDIESGHTLRIWFTQDKDTKLPVLNWHVGCESYPNEAEGKIKLEK
ncbi:hypothetical protein [Metamycoplasma buccale]|uniref:hypothetical protein n=1 Tax=Metamycoplasma buccale TaxID=55602 RepID=UPI00398E67A9